MASERAASSPCAPNSPRGTVSTKPWRSKSTRMHAPNKVSLLLFLTFVFALWRSLAFDFGDMFDGLDE